MELITLWVKEKISVYESVPTKEEVNFLSPWKVFGFTLVLALALSAFDWRRKKLSTWFDVIILSVTGLLGAALFFCGLEQITTPALIIFNLLWALPTNLLAAISPSQKEKARWAGLLL